jgi:hypothetical protein
MRIAFLITGTRSRNKRWNGYELRHGGAAVSGTDQSAVLYAEYLASRGHLVHYYSETCLNGSEFKGVTYYDRFASLDYDAMVVSFDLVMVQFPKLKTLVVYCQCSCLPPQKACETFRALNPACKMRAVHVSDWGRRATMLNSRHYSEFIERDTVIHNPLMMDVIPGDPGARVPRSGIFHATWMRGGEVAKRVHDRLGFGAFRSFNYDTHHGVPGQASVDKSALFKMLAESDYFVYPLVNTAGQYQHFVHKDTFGCVVAEALAMGVIVVTWKVAALPELYGDHIKYAEWPSGADLNGLQSPYEMKEPLLMSDEAVEKMARVIEALEADPAAKERLREEGMKFARARFRAESEGPLWEEILG